jgi:hypothetical protein
MTLIIWFYMAATHGFNLGWFIFAGLLWVVEFMTYVMYYTRGIPDEPDDIEKMWEVMTAYQPNADAGCHGKSWAQMCSEKTLISTYVAEQAAYAKRVAASTRSAYAAGYAAFAADGARKAMSGQVGFASWTISTISLAKEETK